jgi:hypothetical protein
MGVASPRPPATAGARVTPIVGMVGVPPDGVRWSGRDAVAMRAALRRVLETVDGRAGFDAP